MSRAVGFMRGPVFPFNGEHERDHAICLMGETSGYVVDPMSAASVLTALSKLIAVPVDPTQLNDRAAEMEKVVQRLLENAQSQHDEE